MKIDTTKYAAMVANAAARVKISSTIFKNFIADIKAVIDGNDDAFTAHESENAIDAHGSIPAARVYNNVDQSVATSTLTALSFNAERFDTDSIHDNVTNNSRLTCRTAGKYQIIGQVAFVDNSTGLRSLNIRLNGATVIAFVELSADNSGANRFQVTTIYDLAVNDYVELVAFQASGVALNVRSTNANSPEFMMVKIG